jgi:hypothetical protein
MRRLVKQRLTGAGASVDEVAELKRQFISALRRLDAFMAAQAGT